MVRTALEVIQIDNILMLILVTHRHNIDELEDQEEVTDSIVKLKGRWDPEDKSKTLRL